MSKLQTDEEIDKANKRFLRRLAVCGSVGALIGYGLSGAAADISSGARFFIATGCGLASAVTYVLSAAFKSED